MALIKATLTLLLFCIISFFLANSLEEHFVIIATQCYAIETYFYVNVFHKNEKDLTNILYFCNIYSILLK